MNKKLFFIFAAFSLLLLAPLISAQEGVATAPAKALPKALPIRVVHVAGSGIVVSAEDAMVFYKAKIMGATITIKNNPHKLGLLFLDNRRYVLRDVNATSDSFEAKLYFEGEEVGMISLQRYEKPGKDIWAGKLVLNEAGYYVYIISSVRNFTPLERLSLVNEWCANPAAANTEACKLAARCRENPNLSDCEKLVERFCLRHLEDARCRKFLREKCTEDPEKEYCVVKEVKNEGAEKEASEEAEVKPKIKSTFVSVSPRAKIARECVACKKKCFADCKAKYDYESILNEAKKAGDEERITALRRKVAECTSECVKDNCKQCVVVSTPRRVVARPPEAIPERVVEKDFCKKCLLRCVKTTNEDVRKVIQKAVSNKIEEVREILPKKWRRVSGIRKARRAESNKEKTTEESNKEE